MRRVNIGSNNGLLPGRRQAIIWTNAGILSIESLETNFSEFFVKNQTFSFKKMCLKMSSVKWQPSCPGEDESNSSQPCHRWSTAVMNGSLFSKRQCVLKPEHSYNLITMNNWLDVTEAVDWWKWSSKPWDKHQQSTARCRYNAVNFLQNSHEKPPIARPVGRGMGCLLWVQPLLDILLQFLRWCVQYHVMLDRVIAALDCT